MTSLVKPLVLERAALDDVLRHAREADPDECCGALVERRGRDEVWRLENVQDQLHARDPVANPRTARTAYALGHRDVARIDDATTGDPEIGTLKAIYHSHAMHGAYFSGEDRARAMFGDEPTYPDVAYLVVSDARTAGEARAFRWNEAEHDFAEVAVEIR
jgi:proteasome lid subunit RPN8/RPN11